MARFVIDTSALEQDPQRSGQMYVICSRAVSDGDDPDDVSPRIAIALGPVNLGKEIRRLRSKSPLNSTTYVHVEAAAKSGSVYVVDDGELD